MGKTLISEVFWNAECSCGWQTVAPNEPEVVCDKIKIHLLTFHRGVPAGLKVTSYFEVRQLGLLPALGRTATPPPGVTEIDAAASLA